MARSRSDPSTSEEPAALLAETGLVRAASYLQPGEPSADGRELHRRGGRQVEDGALDSSRNPAAMNNDAGRTLGVHQT
jgi:hypothetical protein